MKEVLSIIGIGLVVILIFTVGIRARGCMHYGLFYQEKVQEEIQPLVERIDALEERVTTLEADEN